MGDWLDRCDWVFESYGIAKKRIYPGLPAGPSSAYPLPKNYYTEMRPVVDEQIGFKMNSKQNRIRRIINGFYKYYFDGKNEDNIANKDFTSF